MMKDKRKKSDLILDKDTLSIAPGSIMSKVSDKDLLVMMTELSNEWFFSFEVATDIIQYYGSIVESFGQSTTASVSLGASLELGVVHPDDSELFLRFIDNIKKGLFESLDIRYKQMDGTYRYYRIMYKTINDKKGVPVFVVGKGVDVHDQKILEERSKIDLLTECYNKISAEQLIEEVLQQQNDTVHALFIVDIDNFKSINDNFGHFFGDEVLKEVAHNLKTSFRTQDIVARIGGDEFIVFVENTCDTDILKSRARKIMEVFNKRYSGADRDYSISGSVGIAMYPDSGERYDELYKSADKALYQAKMLGKNQFVFYNDSLVDGTMRDLTRVENANRVAGSYFDYALISAVFDILYENNANDQSVDKVMQIIGQKYDADRCYIFETFDNGETYDNTFEWCKLGVSAEIDNLKGVTKEVLSTFFTDATEQGILYTNDLNSMFGRTAAYDLMADQGIKSFAHAQIKKGEQVTFFLGLDDCTKQRVWSEKEINSLVYISKIISIIFQSKHLQTMLGELTEYNKISAYLSEYTNDLVYVSDIDNYELLHVNKAILQALGNPPESAWKNKKCYEILQGKDAPCEFCTNSQLVEGEFYEWTYFNPTFEKLYFLKDSIVPMQGKNVRLEVATDITQLDLLESELKKRLDEERLLISCIDILHSGETPGVCIDRLLAIIANYYGADRCYIFEFDNINDLIHNTYEWCSEGVVPQKDNLQNVDKSEIKTWCDKFIEEGEFFIDKLDSDLSKDSPEYDTLSVQGIESLVTAPIKDEDDELTGFIGVDNPKRNSKNTLLMRSIARFVANFLDETRLLEELNRLSYYDTLTGIKNRHSFSGMLRQLDRIKFTSLGVAYIDVLGLKSINEVNGSEYGDEVLKRLTKDICQVFADDVYRVGGDEFIVIKRDVTEERFEKDLTELKALIAPENFDANIGYTWNKTFSNVSNLKDTSKGNRYRSILSQNLESEIKGNKFVVYLQPQMDIQDSHVSGAEALVRRVGGDNMLQPPDSFIPFYEKEGMITLIDLHVFEVVCKTIKFWMDSGSDKGVSVAVNCSRMTVIEPGIVEKLSQISDRYGVERSRIIIEITETISDVSEQKMSQITSNFSKVGFKLSLDDFGSGYSNLSTLKFTDFDEVKLDRSLTSELVSDEKSRLLTHSALKLCNEMDGLVSIAEGIEYEEQHEILKTMNCHKGQGFYFARPMPIEEFNRRYIL